MKQFKLKYKIAAIVLVVTFTTQSLSSINKHTYTVGFDNFHEQEQFGLFSCWEAYSYHSSYNCGKAFHAFD